MSSAQPAPGVEVPTEDSIFDKCGNKMKGTPGKVIVVVMRVLNVLNGLALGAVYPLGFDSSDVELGFENFFLSGYCIIFSALLVIFELGIPIVNRLIKREFGFVNAYLGKTVFMIFIASLAMAAGYFWGYFIGVLSIVNALFNCWIVYTHPAFRPGGDLHPEGVTAPGQGDVAMYDEEYGGGDVVASASAVPGRSSDGFDVQPAAPTSSSRSGADDPFAAAAAAPAPSPPTRSAPYDDDNPFSTDRL